jgi:hypothetical protein
MYVLKAAWRRIRDFAGMGGDATYLWPRWLVLRGVGLVYVLVFAGISVEGSALIGPNGVAPVARFCEIVAGLFPNVIERFIRAPSLFWISTAPGTIDGLAWCGMGAAIALVLNLWPRMALFICWLILLSFVSTWQIFSPTIIDQLMIETALLCIPFAPAGLRPGLGASTPPRAIALFMMRWLLFRIMFGSGLIKLFAGDSHWRDLTALDVMHETNPSPTILGFFDHQLPHAFHVFEITVTFIAELLAPLLAVFGGRWGRWIALGSWFVLQAGIQLTGNFGWLNTAAIALGLLLLDDQMIAAVTRKLRLKRLTERIAYTFVPPPIADCSWLSRSLVAGLWLHFGLTIYAFGILYTGRTVAGVPDPKSRPVDFIFRDFQSANAYVPFASFPPAKYEVEFAGSNDGGATWRAYPFRYKPQRQDRIGPFIAPWFARFDSALQNALYTNNPVIREVAKRLLERNPEVTALFEADPFADRPAEVIRMLVFNLSFVDLQTHRETGLYWKKEYVSDFAEPVHLDELNRKE